MEITLRKLSPPALLGGVFILAGFPFLVVELFHAQLYHVMNIDSYLIFHNIAEFFSIMVSFSIFGVGWFTYGQSKDRHALFLSSAFLAIGLMDFMHIMGYAGMPIFITQNSANKSTQFWIAVRFFAAASFLGSAYVSTDNRARWLTKPILMMAAITVSALVFISIIFFPGQIPATFEEGFGLTPFKKISEYLIISLLALSFIAYWNRLTRTGDRLLLFYLSAFTVCIFSEIVFAVYKSAFDTFNVLGHLYKVIAFYLVYQGIFVASVKNPYLKLVETEERLEQDIAERLQAEGALVKAKEEWERTFNAITDPIMILDTDYRIVKINKAMADKLSLEPSMAKGMTCYKAIHGTEVPPQFCPFTKMLADGQPQSEEIHEPRLGGYFIIGVSPLKDPCGNLLGCIHYTGDITERRQMEEELCRHRDHLEELVRQRTAELQEKGAELGRSQKALVNIVEDLNRNTEELEQANLKLKEVDRLKSMFIASMSHELRTPLNSIIGFSSILHDEWLGPVNAEQKENLAIILNSGKHLLNLVNDVIDVSKIEAGKIEVFAEEFDISGIIAEAANLVRKELEEKGLKLQIESMNQQMHTDRRRLLQCVLNLMSNAVKFTEKGNVTIEARKFEEDIMEISVADTGIGIREDELGKLFQPFVRLESPIKATVPGTGLGLYLSRKLAVDILKGDMFASSEYGKGSRFTLRIPMRLQ